MQIKYLKIFMSIFLLLSVSSCGLDISGNDKDNSTKPGLDNPDGNGSDNGGNGDGNGNGDGGNGGDPILPPEVPGHKIIITNDALVINKAKKETCIDITVTTDPVNTAYTLKVDNTKFTIQDNNKVCFNGTLADNQREDAILTAEMEVESVKYSDQKAVQAINLSDSEIEGIKYSIKITNDESTLVIDTTTKNKCINDILVKTEPAGYQYILSSTDKATDSQILISGNKKFCYYGKLNPGEAKKINLTATLVDLQGKEYKDVKSVTVYNSQTPPPTPPPSQENDDFTLTASNNNYFIVDFNINKKNNKYYEKYIWDFKDGSAPIEDKNLNPTQIHLFKKPGTYNVTVKAVGGTGSVCDTLDCGKDQNIEIPVTIKEEKLSMLTTLPNDNNIYIAFYIIGESKSKSFQQDAGNIVGYPRDILLQFRNENNNQLNVYPKDGLWGYKEATGWSYNKGLYMQVPFYIYDTRMKFKNGGKFFDFENFAIIDPKVTILMGGLAFVRMNTSNSLKFNLTGTYDSSKHRNIAKFVVTCQTARDMGDDLQQCSSEFIGFEPKN